MTRESFICVCGGAKSAKAKESYKRLEESISEIKAFLMEMGNDSLRVKEFETVTPIDESEGDESKTDKSKQIGKVLMANCTPYQYKAICAELDEWLK